MPAASVPTDTANVNSNSNSNKTELVATSQKQTAESITASLANLDSSPLDGNEASGNSNSSNSSNSNTSSIDVVRIGEGEIFGEISFLEGSPASFPVLADSPELELFVIEGHTMQLLFEWKPELAARFFKVCQQTTAFFLLTLPFTLQYLATVIEKRLFLRERLLMEQLKASTTTQSTHTAPSTPGITKCT